jgi:uncharacterized protein (TIGR00725 family)
MEPRPDAPYVAVVGGGDAPDVHCDWAEAVGRGLGEAGAVLVCGGLGGVMEAASRGAHHAGGRTFGILPGDDRSAANPYVHVALPTGMGEARNALVVRAADAVVAVGGGYGTLSEIALALRTGVPVVGLDTWDPTPPSAGTGSDVEAVVRADDAAHAVRLVLALAQERRPSRRSPT